MSRATASLPSPETVVVAVVMGEETQDDNKISWEGGAWLRIPPNKVGWAVRQAEVPPPAWLRSAPPPQLWFPGRGETQQSSAELERGRGWRFVLVFSCLLATSDGLFSAECVLSLSPGARLAPRHHRAVTGQWRGIAHRDSWARTGQI